MVHIERKTGRKKEEERQEGSTERRAGSFSLHEKVYKKM